MDNKSKRVFDIVTSFLILLVISPILIFIAVLIKATSKGPIFYHGVRIGLNGKPFKIFKFRTMIVGADKDGVFCTPDNDSRITKAGRFIRKYKLDELPQFINVLRGEMSIVGPRPEASRYVKMFTREEEAILTVRPGITDWASIRYLDEGQILAEVPDPEKIYLERIRPYKIELQLEYVRSHSMSGDMEIISRTAKELVGKLLRKQK